MKKRWLVCIVIFLVIAEGYGQNLGRDTLYLFSSQIERRFEKDNANQQAATAFSFIGDCRNAHAYFDKTNSFPGKLNSEDSLRFLRMKPVSARDYIVARSKTEQIVMINEAHHVPQHRVLTLSLLQAMYDNGFRYFGAETLTNLEGILDPNPMDSLHKRRYPTLETGYYTVEPQYGELIRVAVKIGFKVFAYEARSFIPKERETEQVRNVQKILLKDPQARILIHCGYAHINEDSLGGDWGKAMAGRFKELTGIDPLTINQQTLTERSRPEIENPYFRMANVAEPSVFINEKGEVLAGYKGLDGVTAYDIRVAHPRSKYVNGRPDWLLTNGQRKPQVVSRKSLNKIGYPCLVFAYYNDENPDIAVPADVMELKHKNDKKNLLLKPGVYKIILKNTAGNSTESVETVK